MKLTQDLCGTRNGNSIHSWDNIISYRKENAGILNYDKHSYVYLTPRVDHTPKIGWNDFNLSLFQDGSCILENYNCGEFGLLGNFLISDGNPGKVLDLKLMF